MQTEKLEGSNSLIDGCPRCFNFQLEKKEETTQIAKQKDGTQKMAWLYITLKCNECETEFKEAYKPYGWVEVIK